MSELASQASLLERLFEGAAEQRVVFARRALVGLDAVPAQLLVGLFLHPGMTVGDLAKRAELAQPGVSRGLRELRQLGLADEELDAGDARVRRYRLSDQGKRLLAEFADEAEALLKVRTEGLA